MEKDQRPHRKREEIFDISSSDLNKEDFYELLKGNLEDNEMQKEDKKQIENKFSIIPLIIYGTALIISIIMIIISFPENDNTQNPKLKKVILNNNSPKEVSYSLWGPLSFPKKDVQVRISITATGLAPKNSGFSYSNQKKENWISGEVNLVDKSKLENNNELYSNDKLLKIINGATEDKKQAIIEIFSFPFNLWSYYEKSFYEGYREDDLSKKVEFKINEAGSYYLLLKHYIQYERKISNQTVTLQQKKQLIQLYNKKINSLDKTSPNYLKEKSKYENLIQYIQNKLDKSIVFVGKQYNLNHIQFKIETIHSPIIWYIISALIFFLLLLFNLGKVTN